MATPAGAMIGGCLEIAGDSPAILRTYLVGGLIGGSLVPDCNGVEGAEEDLIPF